METNVDFTLNKNIYKVEKNDVFLSNTKLSYSIFDDAIIQPHFFNNSRIDGGLYDKLGDYIDESTLFGFYKSSHTVLPEKCTHIKETTIFIGEMHKCWGHFITDSLSRMWFISLCKNAEFHNYKISYISEGGFKLEGNFLRMFQLLGINPSLLYEVRSPTLFNKVIFPDMCFYEDRKYRNDFRKYTKEYIHLINLIKSNISPSYTQFPKFIYFTSRSYKRNRKAFGEEKIEQYLSSKNFKIVEPEKLLLDDQIAILSNCEIFCSTDGSCGHNAVFLNKKCMSIIIPRGAYKSGYQDTINDVSQSKCFYIDSNLSIFIDSNSPWNGPFYYYVSKQLLNFFNESIVNYRRYLKNNFYDIKKYLSIGTRLNNRYLLPGIYTNLFFNYYKDFQYISLLFKIKKVFHKIKWVKK